MRIRLVPRLRHASISSRQPDVFELPRTGAELLIAEGWAEPWPDDFAPHDSVSSRVMKRHGVESDERQGR
jgi:hypothetical protein